MRILNSTWNTWQWIENLDLRLITKQHFWMKSCLRRKFKVKLGNLIHSYRVNYRESRLRNPVQGDPKWFFRKSFHHISKLCSCFYNKTFDKKVWIFYKLLLLYQPSVIHLANLNFLFLRLFKDKPWNFHSISLQQIRKHFNLNHLFIWFENFLNFGLPFMRLNFVLSKRSLHNLNNPIKSYFVLRPSIDPNLQDSILLEYIFTNISELKSCLSWIFPRIFSL